MNRFPTTFFLSRTCEYQQPCERCCIARLSSVCRKTNDSLIQFTGLGIYWSIMHDFGTVFWFRGNRYRKRALGAVPVQHGISYDGAEFLDQVVSRVFHSPKFKLTGSAREIGGFSCDESNVSEKCSVNGFYSISLFFLKLFVWLLPGLRYNPLP